MIDFVNLTQEEEEKPLIKVNIPSTTCEALDEFVINSPTFDELNEDAICVPECNSNPEGSCKDPSGYFTIDNLFSELLTDYQKLLARRNLGIGDDNILKWGSIKGNLVNQTDLLTFVKEQLTSTTKNINKITDEKIANAISDMEAAQLTTVYYGPDTQHLTFTNLKTFTTGDYSGYIYVLSPNRDTDFSVNGLKGGFEYEDTVYISSKPFYLFRSAYPGLGITKISLSYGNTS